MLTRTQHSGPGIGQLDSRYLKLIGGAIIPTANSTTTFQIFKQDGTTNVLNVDTTNAMVGIGITAPTARLHIIGAADTQQFVVKANATQTSNIIEIQNSSATVLSNFTGTGALHLGDSLDLASGKNITLVAGNIITDTTTGTKIGTATNQKLAFFNSAPIVQPANTVALDDLLVNLGLRASGGAADFSNDIKMASSKFIFSGGNLMIGANGYNTIIRPNSSGNFVQFQSFAGGNQFSISDAGDIQVDATSGMKFATATSQKLGFWNTTPIIQPTTGVAAATFITNTSLIANDTATFDGYTIGQVVKALRNVGLLA